MNAPAVPVSRSSRHPDADSTDDGLGLLVDLFAAEEPPAAAPGQRPAVLSAASVTAYVQAWSRRAAGWGAGPGGVWRAW